MTDEQISRWVWLIRKRLYKAGIRPKAGSIWFSPSLSYIYGEVDKAKK